jgi:hypothetical protein
MRTKITGLELFQVAPRWQSQSSARTIEALQNPSDPSFCNVDHFVISPLLLPSDKLPTVYEILNESNRIIDPLRPKC